MLQTISLEFHLSLDLYLLLFLQEDLIFGLLFDRERKYDFQKKAWCRVGQIAHPLPIGCAKPPRRTHFSLRKRKKALTFSQ